jgi:hypothetical protein
MKTRNFVKKLSLNKTTVVNLRDEELDVARGGISLKSCTNETEDVEICVSFPTETPTECVTMCGVSICYCS